MVVTVSSEDAYPLVKFLADVSNLLEGQRQGGHTVWHGRCPHFKRSVARLKGVRVQEGDSLRFVCNDCLLVSMQPRNRCPCCHGIMRTVVV